MGLLVYLFLIVTLISAVVGFSGEVGLSENVSSEAAVIVGKVLFFVFLGLLLVTLLLDRQRREGE
ncbi:MAG: hypothetical protein Kow0025_18190 [Thermodesulfovibrionales bacterium]